MPLFLLRELVNSQDARRRGSIERGSNAHRRARTSVRPGAGLGLAACCQQDQAARGGAGRAGGRPACIRGESSPGRDDQGPGARRAGGLRGISSAPSSRTRRGPSRPASTGFTQSSERRSRFASRTSDPPIGTPSTYASRSTSAASPRSRECSRMRSSRLPGSSASCRGCGCAASWCFPALRRTSNPSALRFAGFARSATTSMPGGMDSIPCRWECPVTSRRRWRKEPPSFGSEPRYSVRGEQRRADRRDRSGTPVRRYVAVRPDTGSVPDLGRLPADAKGGLRWCPDTR